MAETLSPKLAEIQTKLRDRSLLPYQRREMLAQFEEEAARTAPAATPPPAAPSGAGEITERRDIRSPRSTELAGQLIGRKDHASPGRRALLGELQASLDADEAADRGSKKAAS